MEIIQALLEDNEKILWKKEFPSINLIPDKREFHRHIKIFLIYYIPIMIFSILLILFIDIPDVFKLSLPFSLFIIGLVFPYLIISIYKDKGKTYKKMKKIYPDETLQNYREIYLITNKNIIRRWFSDSEWSFEFEHDYNEKIKHFARYEKDFLILNHQYLRKINNFRLNKEYIVNLYFYSPGVYKKSNLVEFSIEHLSLEEEHKFTATMLEIRKDIILEP